MANFELIEAESRSRAGKGVARATRRAGKVPAVIYGAKQEPSLIALDPRFVMRELKRGGWRSRLYEIQLGTEKTRALMRDVQFHPVTDQPEHVDFQRLASGERVRVSVAVVFLNEATSPGMKRGGVLNVVRHTVEVACDPDNIPEKFEADLGTLEINAQTATFARTSVSENSTNSRPYRRSNPTRASFNSSALGVDIPAPR